MAIQMRTSYNLKQNIVKNQQATCDKILGDFHAYSERLLPSSEKSDVQGARERVEAIGEDTEQSTSSIDCLDLNQRHNPFLSVLRKKTEDLAEPESQQPQLFVNFGGNGGYLGRSADEKNYLMQKLLRLEDSGEKYQEQLLGNESQATLIFAPRAN